MNIMLLGMPGAGKGTQAQFLINRFQIPQISTGDMLRAAVKAGASLGMEAKRYMDKGELCPDRVVIELVKQRVKEADCARGFIIDGFPRTIPQAEALHQAGIDFDYVVEFKVSDEEVLKRLSGRRVHPASGRTYHIAYNPPKVPDRDDITGEPLVQRRDDAENTVRNRIATYHTQTKPLVEYYLRRARSGGPDAPRYLSIDASGSVESVRDKLFSALDGR
ncbi:MAG TPA: adenylate kinase [Burkholderiales bacterium]|nr:adenylate kinase [Burkholderiales bacterium]